MSIRREPTYLTYEVYAALRLLAKARSTEMESGTVTADGLANEMLRAHIAENYPQLFEHQKNVEKLEREMIKTLGET